MNRLLAPGAIDQWIDWLRPLAPEDVSALAELASESSSREAWPLVLEEAGRLLRRAKRPASAALVTAVIQEATGVDPDQVISNWEKACSDAFGQPPTGAQIDRNWLLQTQRSAVALHGLFSRLATPAIAGQDRFLHLLGGLEILARIHDRKFGFGTALSNLVARLKRQFPRMSSELSGFVEGTVADLSVRVVDAHQRQAWRERLDQLCHELNDGIGLHSTRGLALLSRIQSDNNRRILRPIVEAIEASDRLDQDVISNIKGLAGSDLLDRHPLQVSAGGGRRISGTARVDTIRHYDDLIAKAREALDLRLKLESTGRAGSLGDDELERDLAGFIKQWREQHVDAGNWLITRLLSSEVLLVRSHLPIPDASILQLPEAEGLGPATLFAIIEPSTFAAFPRLVSGLPPDVELACRLLEAAAGATGQITSERLIAEAGHLADQGDFVIGRLWAAVSEQLVGGGLELRDKLDTEVAMQRAEFLKQLSEVQHIASFAADDFDQTHSHEVTQHLHQLADLGFLREAHRQLSDFRQENAQALAAASAAKEKAAAAAEPAIEEEPAAAPPLPLAEAPPLSNSPREDEAPGVATAPRAPDEGSQTGEAVDSVTPYYSPATSYLGNRRELDELFARAEHCRTRNLLDDAERLFAGILKQDPGHQRARSQLVLVLDTQGRRNRAIDLLKDGLEVTPSHLPFLHQIVPLLARQGQFADARDYANRGLQFCRNPGEEVGFLNDLMHLERQAGKNANVVDLLQRLVRAAPQVQHYRTLLDQLSGATGDPQDAIAPTSTFELLPWELPTEGLEISPFLASDLQEPHRLVAADFVERKGPKAALDEALRLCRNAVSAPDTTRPGADAEALRTGAKLLMEVHELGYISERSQQAAKSRGLMDHENALRRWLSYYAARKGDDFFLQQRTEPARAYYLEQFRVFARLMPFSLYTADKYIRTSVPEARDVITEAQDYLTQCYSRARDRARHAPEAVVLMFTTTFERYLLRDADHRDPRIARFLSDFLDVCLVNPAARQAALRLTGEPGHRVSQVLWKVRARQVLPIEAETPRDWVERALALRDDYHQNNRHDLSFVLDELLPKRQYPQAIDLLVRVSARGGSATDQRLLKRVEDLFRDAERFQRSRSFEDKRYIWSSVSLGCRDAQDSIKDEPTALGREYLAQILFRLDRDLEAAYQRFHDRSPPLLAVRAVKCVRTDHGIRPDVQVENKGLSPAEHIRLEFFVQNDPDHPIGVLELDRLQPGATNAAVQKVDLELETPENADAVEVMVGGKYADSEGALHDMGPLAVRLGISTHRTYVWIQNPYVTGGIIMDESLFKGRDRLISDILQEIANPSSPGSVVIYGQKRSGKSSILHWIAKRAPEWVVPISLPVQDMFADEAVLPNLLWLMAENIVEEAQKQRGITLPRIDEDALFDARVPSRVFRSYLEQVDTELGGQRRLLLLLDEFTDLTARIERGDIERGFMRYWKSLIEHGLFSSVICGIDSMPQVLKRFSNDFAIANPRMVTYLDDTSARQLIEDPVRLPDGSSRFSEGATERILQLTAGAPYYIQLVCSRLVDHLNREQNPDPSVTRADVDETVRDVIEGRTKLSPWTVFDSLCRYKEDPARDSYSAVLEGLALYALADGMRSAEYVGHDTLVERMKQLAPEDRIEHVLNDLLDRETLMMPTESPVRQYRIRVALFSEWLAANRPLDPQAIAGFARRLESASSLGDH